MFNLNKRIIKQALDLSPCATLIVDLSSHPRPVVYVNQAFEAATGLDAEDLIGRPWTQLLADGAASAVESPGDRVLLQCAARFGEVEDLQVEMFPLYVQPGKPRYWMATEVQRPSGLQSGDESDRDALLTVLRDAQMHLRRLDGKDSSTGLLSRRAFDDLFNRDWMMARREKRRIGLVAFRLDCFAAYCSVYGRHAGDSCLAKVAHAITGSLRRAGDLAARFGDDQFIVLINGADDEHLKRLARSIAQKVRVLSIHHPRSTADRFVTVSWGAATAIPTGADQADSFLEQVVAQLDTETSGHEKVDAL